MAGSSVGLSYGISSKESSHSWASWAEVGFSQGVELEQARKKLQDLLTHPQKFYMLQPLYSTGYNVVTDHHPHIRGGAWANIVRSFLIVAWRSR